MQHWAYQQAPAGAIEHGSYSGCIVMALPERSLAWAIFGTVTCTDPGWQKAFADISESVVEFELLSRKSEAK
jgi:hypothetical protein